MKIFQVTFFYGIKKIIDTEIMAGDSSKLLREKYLNKHPRYKRLMKDPKYWIGFKRVR